MVVYTKMDGVINLEYGLTTPPTSLTLQKSVDISSNCCSVYQYKGHTYVGQENGAVDRIDEHYEVTKSFIRLDGWISGIAVSDVGIFLLVAGGDNFNVYWYDVEGLQLCTWRPSDISASSIRENFYRCSPRDQPNLTHIKHNQISMFENNLLVPNRSNSKLTIYSPDGKEKNQVTCSIHSDSKVAICAASCNSVIVSHSAGTGIRRIDVNSGAVIWTSTVTTDGFGVCCYRHLYVCAATSAGKIQVLKMETG